MRQKGVRSILSRFFGGVSIVVIIGPLFLFIYVSPIKDAAGQVSVVEDECPEERAACVSRQAEADAIIEQIRKISEAITNININIKNNVDIIEALIKEANERAENLNFLAREANRRMAPNGPIWAAQVEYGRAARANAGQMDQPLRELLDSLAAPFGRTFQDALSDYINKALDKLKAEIDTVAKIIDDFKSKYPPFMATVNQIEDMKKRTAALIEKVGELEKQYEALQALLRKLKEAPSFVVCPLPDPPGIPGAASGATGPIPTVDQPSEPPVFNEAMGAQAIALANEIHPVQEPTAEAPPTEAAPPTTVAEAPAAEVPPTEAAPPTTVAEAPAAEVPPIEAAPSTTVAEAPAAEVPTAAPPPMMTPDEFHLLLDGLSRRLGDQAETEMRVRLDQAEALAGLIDAQIGEIEANILRDSVREYLEREGLPATAEAIDAEIQHLISDEQKERAAEKIRIATQTDQEKAEVPDVSPEVPPVGEELDIVTVGDEPSKPIIVGGGEEGVAVIDGGVAVRPPRFSPYSVMETPDLKKTGIDFDRYTSTEGSTELVGLGFRGIESHTLERGELGGTARIVAGVLIPGFSTQVEVQEQLYGSWADALNIVLFATLFNLVNTITENEASPKDIVDIRNAALAGDEAEVRKILDRLGGTHPPAGSVEAKAGEVLDKLGVTPAPAKPGEGIIEDFISEIIRIGAMTKPEEVVSLVPRMLPAVSEMGNQDLNTILMNLSVTAGLILRSQEAAKMEKMATVTIILAPIGLSTGLIGGAISGTATKITIGKAVAITAFGAISAVDTAFDTVRINEEIRQARVAGDLERLKSLETEKDLAILFAAISVLGVGFDAKQIGLAVRAHRLTSETAKAIQAATQATSNAVRAGKMDLARKLAGELALALKNEARFAQIEFRTFAAITAAQVAIAAGTGDLSSAILPVAMLGIRGGTAFAAARGQRSRGATVDTGTPVTVVGQQGEFVFVGMGKDGKFILRGSDGGQFTFAPDAEILTTSGAKPIFPGNKVAVAGQSGEFVFVGRNELGEIVLRGEQGEITVPRDTEIASAKVTVEPRATAKDLKEGATIRIDGRKEEFVVLPKGPNGLVRVMEASDEVVDLNRPVKIPRIFNIDPEVTVVRIVPKTTEAAPPAPPVVRPSVSEEPTGGAHFDVPFEPGTVVRIEGRGDIDFFVEEGVLPDGRIMVRRVGAPDRDPSKADIDSTIVSPKKLTVAPPRAPAETETSALTPPKTETAADLPATRQKPAGEEDLFEGLNLDDVLPQTRPAPTGATPTRQVPLPIEIDSAGRQVVRTGEGDIFLGKEIGRGGEAIVYEIVSSDGRPTGEVMKILTKLEFGDLSSDARRTAELEGILPVASVKGVVLDENGNVVGIRKEFVAGTTLDKGFKKIRDLQSTQDPDKLAEAAQLRERLSIALGDFLARAFGNAEIGGIARDLDLKPENLILRDGTAGVVLIDAGRGSIVVPFRAKEFDQFVGEVLRSPTGFDLGDLSDPEIARLLDMEIILRGAPVGAP